MTWAMDRYRDYMAEEGDDGLNRGYLHNSGYKYDDDEGCWLAVFVNKRVVARKDHPKFGIVKGQKHRFIKTKYICDETGASSWGVQRIALPKPKPKPVFEPAYSRGWSSPTDGWTGSTTWGTNSSWTRKDK